MTTPTVQQLDTALVDIGALTPHPENANRHTTAGAVSESLDIHGQYKPIGVQRSTGHIVYGNGLYAQLLAKGAPQVLVTWLDLDDDEAARILAVDNATGDGRTYRREQLLDLLDRLALTKAGLSGTGYAPADLDTLRTEVKTRAPMFHGEGVPKPEDDDPVTQLGELWTLGPHKVLCGSSIEELDVDRLLDGDGPIPLIYTDPPYGVGYTGGMSARPPLIGDDSPAAARELYRAPFDVGTARGTSTVLLWYVHLSYRLVQQAIEAAGWEWRSELVWIKNTAQFGAIGSHYKAQHESLAYAVNPKAPSTWAGPTNEVTVWQAARASKNEWHPTQKPVELAERAITNHTGLGDLVLDLYGGGGSTLIGAHRQGRHARLMEIEPIYVDRILTHYQTVTGDQPVGPDGPHDFLGDD